MRLIFAVFGLALIITGAVLLLVPREEATRAQTRSSPGQIVSLATKARDIADQVNGPLSIVFGVISLYYSRRRYVVERDSHAHDKTT